ncbi:MAG: hypothetical protein E6K59_12625 [Nitrospirae bacterium]|nr:MAG: hypothetical protein E6K59_12625 [Nitrospirota bacterium]
MAKTKAKVRSIRKKAAIGISRVVWEWARAYPRYENLMEELEDLEDLRREKAKKEKGIPFTEVLKEYELVHHVALA